MIKIAPKQHKTDDAGPSHETYAQKEQGSSIRTPAAIAAILTGVMVYFRSLFVEASPAPDADASPAREPAPAAASPKDIKLAQTGEDADAGARKPEEDEDAPAAPLLRPGGGSSGRVFNSFMTEDKPLDFGRLAARPDAYIPNSFAKPVNDNASPQEDPVRMRAAAPGGGETGGPKKDPDPKTPDEDDARNRAPRVSGPVRLSDIVQSHPVFVPLALLLSGATDADLDKLSVVGLKASSGRLEPTEGGWIYTPADLQLGGVELTYAVSDGKLSVAQTAAFDVLRQPPIAGGAGDDILVGTAQDDTIDAQAGDDAIDARAGRDVIHAGDGADHIVAGDGDDIVYAGPGDDIVFGGSGHDILHGQSGDDRLFGEQGDDVIDGGAGRDIIHAGLGADLVFGGDGDDRIFGDDDSDSIDGGAGDDIISGGAGADVLLDGAGADRVAGDAGDDVFLASMDAASDIFQGQDGFDTLSFADAKSDLVIDVPAGSSAGVDSGQDSFSGFESFIGGKGDDTFLVGAAPVSLQGGEGRDTFSFSDMSADMQMEERELVHEILDLDVGDRIVVRGYEIRRLDPDDDDDHDGRQDDQRFESHYLNESDDMRPFRFRVETREDDREDTYIDVFRNEDTDELEIAYSINVHGRQHLTYGDIT
ncbi:MAG: cadherin-like domain-containing protein [Beijerinckiaceae bacterium]|nr:cadherin-like domain-containing protein [Beijerinckiaceae bacterium]